MCGNRRRQRQALAYHANFANQGQVLVLNSQPGPYTTCCSHRRRERRAERERRGPITLLVGAIIGAIRQHREQKTSQAVHSIGEHEVEQQHSGTTNRERVSMDAWEKVELPVEERVMVEENPPTYTQVVNAERQA